MIRALIYEKYSQTFGDFLVYSTIIDDRCSGLGLVKEHYKSDTKLHFQGLHEAFFFSQISPALLLIKQSDQIEL